MPRICQKFLSAKKLTQRINIKTSHESTVLSLLSEEKKNPNWEIQVCVLVGGRLAPETTFIMHLRNKK